jgi:hypothetical protein
LQYVSQVLERALDCESRAKDSRGCTRSGDKSRNKRHANMIECSSVSSDDEEANMCVAEWNWVLKSKPFICSSVKPATKIHHDEMRYTFDVAKCYRIFDYLLQEKQIKLPSNHVVPSPKHPKNMHIVNGIIPILMILMIAMFSIIRLNRP